jgi:hypothetical protein
MRRLAEGKSGSTLGAGRRCRSVSDERRIEPVRLDRQHQSFFQNTLRIVCVGKR